MVHADALFDVEGIHISSVTATGRGLVLGVETGEDVTGCPPWATDAGGFGFMTSRETLHLPMNELRERH